ncbi:MAG: hypothetical protein JXA13_16510 [Anaerolineales bacterium]|nr:hypothetical protein [Anaerolineales bacterium]
MNQVTQEQSLRILKDDWGRYLADFKGLSPQEQRAFLEDQGYASFHDLLAHICAWWEETLTVINSILDNEEVTGREYDIDQFNAEAIIKFRKWDPVDLETHFENLRQSLVDLVIDLPDEALAYQRITTWMHACVVEHAEEHKIRD